VTRSILVVAAHPDDEVLGCGGTLAKLAAQGSTINVAFMSDGVSSRRGDAALHEMQLKARRTAARQAAVILGVNEVTFGEFPDNRMDSIALIDITRAVEDAITKCTPDTVFTHYGADLNIDHRRVHEAVVTACRPQAGHPVRTVLCFEIPSSTEWQVPGSAPAFAPNWFEDIAGTMDVKLAALQAYAEELRGWPHPRSIQGVEDLARWRGATIGARAAEAFVLARHIA
jgi:LmbE family N-acetylglucosaminyl deacetylase